MHHLSLQPLKARVAGACGACQHMALLRHRTVPPIYESAATAAANKLGLKVQVLTVGEARELDGAFKTAQTNRAQGLLVLPSPFLSAERRAIIRLAAAYRLPAFYEFREFVEDGGHMSYGPSIPEMYRRAAYYVDRVLKGTKPSDLPIERASTFELAVNLKTAKALGISISPTILVQATRLIE